MRLKEFFQKNCYTIRIRTFLIITSIILSLFFLIIESAISCNIYQDIINKKTEAINNNNLQQVTDKINFEIKQIENLANDITTNVEIKQYLKEYYNSDNDVYTTIFMQNQVRQALSEMMLGYGIATVDLYFSDGKSLLDNTASNSALSFSYDRLDKTSIYKKITSSPKKSIVLGPDYKDESFNCTESFFTYATLITYSDNETGILFLQLGSDWLNSIIKKEREVLLMDKSVKSLIWSEYNLMKPEINEIAGYCILEQGSFSLDIGKERYYFYYQDIGDIDWVVLIAQKASEILKPIYKTKNYAIFSIILGCLLSFSIGEFVSKRNTQPVNTLIQKVSNLDINEPKQRPKRERRNTSIRDSFMLFYIVVISIPMVVYTVTFYISASAIINDIIKESLVQTLNKAANSIDSFIDGNEQLSLSISKDDFIQSFLMENYEKETEVTLNDVILVDKAVIKYPAVDKSIMQIDIYDSKKRMIYSSSDYTMGRPVNNKYEKMLENSYGNTVWNYIDTDMNGKRVVSLFRKIYGKNSDKYSLKTIGYLSITLYGLKSLYENISYESSNFYILDKDGFYISNKFDYLIGEPSDYIPAQGSLSYRNQTMVRSDKNSIEVIYSNCTTVPWMLVGEIKNKDISKENGQIISSSLYLVFSMCILIFILSYIISLSFSKSFDSMSKKLVNFGNGDMNVDFTSVYYFNEIDMLSKTFDNMADRINELTETLFYEQLNAEELEREKKESELIALQAQINPHFLYNTFESIKWMMDYNAKNAAVMLTQLGDLFRLGINRKSQFITIEEEIKYAKTYIDIQKVRYGENIKISWSVDNNTVKYMVPKLILQPLIENVFIHGFKTRKENGSINIYCFIEDDNIVFKIMDNGEGITKDMLEEINNKLKGVLLGESVGIYNVQKRIRLYYGENSGITLVSQVGVGTIVKLSIPIPEKRIASNY